MKFSAEDAHQYAIRYAQTYGRYLLNPFWSMARMESVTNNLSRPTGYAADPGAQFASVGVPAFTQASVHPIHTVSGPEYRYPAISWTTWRNSSPHLMYPAGSRRILEPHEFPWLYHVLWLVQTLQRIMPILLGRRRTAAAEKRSLMERCTYAWPHTTLIPARQAYSKKNTCALESNPFIRKYILSTQLPGVHHHLPIKIRHR